MTVIVVYNHLPRVIATVLSADGEMARDVAQGMRDKAEAKAPVLSGALKASIHLEGGGNDYQVTAKSTEGGATRDYAHFVEYGTSKMRAQPYMRPAFVAGVALDLPRAAAEFGRKVEAAA